MCKCENCELRATNEARYKLKMEWLSHGQAEEMHQRYAKTNTVLNEHTDGYHREMQAYHKNERLKLERQMRG